MTVDDGGSPLMAGSPAEYLLGDVIDFGEVVRLGRAACADLAPVDLQRRTAAAEAMGCGDAVLVQEPAGWFSMEWPPGTFLCRFHRAQVTPRG